jgi:HAD superfamily hydrolase (TIGR01549 family)
MEASMIKLHAALSEAGLITDKHEFFSAYGKAHDKYRAIRYGELREITNTVWLSEALSNLGFDVSCEDLRLKAALNVFFQDYVESLELRPYAKKLLKKAAGLCKLGLISNFTYAPVVYSSLRRLGISQFFNVVVVSGECGWRKPHQKVFSEAFEKLKVKVSEAVFVGDSPNEDIKGAIDIGLKTVFVCSQFFCLNDLKESGQKPDFAVNDLKYVFENLQKILSL